MNDTQFSFEIHIKANDIRYWVVYDDAKARKNPRQESKIQTAPVSHAVVLAQLNTALRRREWAVLIFLGTFLINILLVLYFIVNPRNLLLADVLFVIFIVAFLTILGLFLGLRTWKRDQALKTVAVQYRMDALSESRYEALTNGVSQLAASKKIWQITAAVPTSDWKRNAGADIVTNRIPISVHTASPPHVSLNLKPYVISLGRAALFFLPDCILVYQNRRFSSIAYDALLFVSATVSSYREDTAVPSDARVVGQTWRYVRKDGGPDLRFKNNWRTTIVDYGQVDFGYLGRLKVSLAVSNALYARNFANALTNYVDFLAGRVKQPTGSSQQRSNPNHSYGSQSSYKRSESASSSQSRGSSSKYGTNTQDTSQRGPEKESTRRSSTSEAHGSQQDSSERSHNQRQKERQNSNNIPDPYAVLKISRQATKDEVTAAYRKLVKQYHPDKVAHLGSEFQVLAEQKMRDINAAYEQLKRQLNI